MSSRLSLLVFKEKSFVLFSSSCFRWSRGPSFNRPSICRRPDRHTRFFFPPFCLFFGDVSFSEYFLYHFRFLSLYWEYIVRSQSINQSINQDALHRTQCESIETTVRTRRLLWAGALLRMGDHRLPKRVMSGELENAGKRGPGGKEKEWTDCVADDLRLFGVTGDWKTAALDPGAWYNTVQEGGCRFMAAWVREEENASNQRQKKRDAEEADKVEVAPGVTVASLRRFRTALIGPTQGLPKRRRLCH